MPAFPNDLSDWRFFDAELRANFAYADALVGAGLLSVAERDQIKLALNQIEQEHAAGTLTGDNPFRAIEVRLQAIVGSSAAAKLQAGRSHTEQIITALRLWLLEQMEPLSEQIADVQRALLHQAEGHVGALMPGYVHFQPVQVVSFSHWLLSYFWMLARDQERLVNTVGRTSISPLGSGLLAGSPYRIDRNALAQAMAFTEVTQNSMDAVSDWDFAAEFLFVASLIATHLSRLAEELLLFSSPVLGFISFEEALDVQLAALIDARGAAGWSFGQVAGYMGTLNTYNGAEQRQTLLKAVDSLARLLPELARTIETLTVNADRMWDAIDDNTLQGDLIDYLAAHGVPSVEAQAITRRVLQRAEQANLPLSELELADLQAESSVFDQEVYALLDFSRSAGQRTATGGTAASAVRVQIRQANVWLVDAGFE